MPIENRSTREIFKNNRIKEEHLPFLSENLLGRSKRDAIREKLALKKSALSNIYEVS